MQIVDDSPSPPSSAITPAILSESRIDVVDGPIERNAVLIQLVRLVVDDEKLSSDQVSETLSALIAREQLASTALRSGIAIPHHRMRSVADHIGAAVACRDGVDCGALDREPTLLVVLLLSPIDARLGHVEWMGRLAGIGQDGRLRHVARAGSRAQLTQFLLDCTRFPE